MVNFHDPTVAVWDAWALAKLHHAVDSLYLWEFFFNLDYEWSIIRGHRPYRWTIWIYSLTRVSTLVSVILNIVGIDVSTPIQCQVWLTFELIFGYLAFVCASLLIVLRIIAIWNKDKVVVAVATGVWVVNIGFLIQGIARVNDQILPTLCYPSGLTYSQRRSTFGVSFGVIRSCVVDNMESSKLNIIATLITDIGLLLIMLIGLLRIRRYGGVTFGLGRLLWRQVQSSLPCCSSFVDVLSIPKGVIWLILASIAEIPPMVLIYLNLNYPLNLIFQIPALTIMSIAATRMYRSLADFASGFTDRSGIPPFFSSPRSRSMCFSVEESAQYGGHGIPRVHAVSLTPMEVSLNTTREQCLTSQTSAPSGDPYIHVEVPMSDKPRRPRQDENMESGRQ
ncbi:hypothetical protein F5148DRAFT_1369800 [Russula earlei]|uniref:Uncharacterized protein n=1 Tax=Russula earlei TaxID=71964 RepID=A0ACC0U1F1_9AGAM|nr:hypothetical protein F5148DRAFT_1369800 [Russula earlei]